MRRVTELTSSLKLVFCSNEGRNENLALLVLLRVEIAEGDFPHQVTHLYLSSVQRAGARSIWMSGSQKIWPGGLLLDAIARQDPVS
jgi:hypothetical protein